MTATVNQWEARYGARRRAIDRALLAEAEAAIGLEENARPHSAAPKWIQAEMREQISFEDSERQRIARAFGRPPR